MGTCISAGHVFGRPAEILRRKVIVIVDTKKGRNKDGKAFSVQLSS